LVAPWKRACYIDGYHLERCPDHVLVHLAPIPSPGAVTCCADVAQSVPSLNIALCLEPVVPLPNLIQGFVDTQATSWRLTV
jgi:hypothetical protein